MLTRLAQGGFDNNLAFNSADAFVTLELSLSDSSIILRSTGAVTINSAVSGPTAYLVTTGVGAGAGYEAQIYLATLSGGTFAFGGTGLTAGQTSAWLPLSADRTFSAGDAGSPCTATGTLTIRSTAAGNTISRGFTLEVA